MKVSFKITKKDLPRLIAALVLAGVGIGFSVTAFYDAIIWFAFLFLLTFITVKIDDGEEGKKKFLRLIPEIILPVFASFLLITHHFWVRNGSITRCITARCSDG